MMNNDFIKYIPNIDNKTVLLVVLNEEWYVW